MRKLISGMFITYDGVVENPHGWNPPYYNQEMTDAVQGLLAASDTHLYGRRSYEMFRSVFTGPTAATIPHAPIMNETRKVLVSHTIENPDWGPTTVITGDIAGQIRTLKDQPGKNISVEASGTLVRFLLEEGLLDELHLLVHPIVVGAGKRLFEGGGRHVPLRVLDSRTFSTGVVSVSLASARNADAASESALEPIDSQIAAI